MSAWITDRVPTQEDAPEGVQGSVWVQLPEERRILMHFTHLLLGTPWQPITYPEPYVKPMKWSIRISPSTGKPFLAKNGLHALGMCPFTKDELKAIVDALNRLEESHD